jgi:hypothetical protein
VTPMRYELGFYIPEDDILHSHRRENLKSCIELTGRALMWRYTVSSVKYELGFYILGDGILHSHRHENPKSYIAVTGLAQKWRYPVSCEVRTGFLYPRRRHSS